MCHNCVLFFLLFCARVLKYSVALCLISSTNEVMFTCLLVVWIVSRITQKLPNRFPSNMDDGWVSNTVDPINFWRSYRNISLFL